MFGYSVFSQIISILAAQAPTQPTAPTTTISGNSVLIDWVQPNQNGSPITSYFVFIQQNDLSFGVDLANCDGSTATIVANAGCSVLISTLTAAPFSLPWGSSIFAKIIAVNNYGPSTASPVGNGAVILTIPDAPLNVANDAAVTSSH